MPGTIAGFIGRIIVNSTALLRASRWSVDYHVDNFDVTGFENNGLGTYVGGLADFDISFDAYWDVFDNPFAAPLAIFPGNVVALTILYNKLNGAATRWVFPKVFIVTAHAEGSVRDVVRYSITGKATDDTNPVPAFPTVPVN